MDDYANCTFDKGELQHLSVLSDSVTGIKGTSQSRHDACLVSVLGVEGDASSVVEPGIVSDSEPVAGDALGVEVKRLTRFSE